MRDIPEELTKMVTRRLHDEGIEMTPAEVDEARDGGLDKLRALLAPMVKKAGLPPLPESDAALMVLIAEILNRVT